MAKKIYFVVILVLAFFIWPNLSRAANSEEETKQRYAGSILAEDNGFSKQYWYVEPLSQNRYLLKDQADLDEIIKKFHTGINTKNLEKLPTVLGDKKADYNLVQKFRGYFLLQVDKDGGIWYINPLDNLRYSIPINTQGLQTLEALALDISYDRLTQIPIGSNKVSTSAPIDFSRYWTIVDTLKKNYYRADEIDDATLFYGSLKGLVTAVDDPYTEFFTPQGKKQFDDRINNSVEGIGAMVDIKDSVLTVITALDGTPAQSSGLVAGDQILAVDNQDIEGFSLEKSISLIKGPAGSSVTLKIRRPNTGQTFNLTITRARISVPNITGKRLDNNVAYIKINSFSPYIASEFQQISKQVIDSSTKSLILDLRNNPGGYTNSALYVADQWLDTGALILQEKFPNMIVQYSAQTPVEINLPTVVLVNSGSASASEIVTSALKENKKAVIVGEKTYGKGTGQELVNFPDGSALKYTTFEWLTPLGNSIEKQGISPDYEISGGASALVDNQLSRALEILR